MSVSKQLAEAQKKKSKQAIILLLGNLVLLMGLIITFLGFRGMDVIISPDDASEQSQLSVTQGPGWIMDNKVYALFGSVEITVTAAGFYPEKRQISHKLETSYLEIVMQEKPATLSLKTQPLSATSQWLIDGDRIGEGAEIEIKKMAGSYQIEVDNPFYRATPVKIDVLRDEVKEILIELQTIKGTLSIASKPRGASLYLNGNMSGQTPLVNQYLSAAAYQVELRHPDYKTVQEQILITKDKPNPKRSYRLVPKPASVIFNTKPGKGTLLIDGRKVSSATSLTVDPLVKHHVLYQSPGYKDYSSYLQLNPGESKTVSINLQQDIGRVFVKSVPEAYVYVNNIKKGETPLVLNLTAIQHNISLRKAGYRQIDKMITPSSAQEKSIVESLLTELDYRRKTQKPKYINSAGISMLRYQPTRFTMGAPRSEKGQRGNEFIRKISLAKEFYVSITEITQTQYAKYQSTKAVNGSGTLPQTDLSWTEAAKFCNWLSQQEKLTPVYQFNGQQYRSANLRVDGYRLPTEAEWEWLARKAKRNKQARFTWGDSYTIPKSSGNLADENAIRVVPSYIPGYKDGFEKLAPVASFPVEKSGLYDLSGNVSEWVHDYYSFSVSQTGIEEVDPAGPDWGEGHVIKGSSWRSASPSQLRASYRNSQAGTRDDVGFRIARYLYGAENETYHE